MATKIKITKTKLKAFVKDKLLTDSQWAVRGLKLIFKNQTSDEVCSQYTSHQNGIGFSQFDAEILTSFHNFLVKYNRLSGKQMAILHKKISKYANQIIKYADEEKMEYSYLYSIDPVYARKLKCSRKIVKYC